MADRLIPAGEDLTHTHYVWDSGWLVSFNKFTHEWTKQRIPHPSDIPDVPTPNREAAPECHADD